MSEQPREHPDNYEALFPGRFLKSGLFEGQKITLTIREVYRESLPKDDGTEVKRGILAFKRDTSTPLLDELSQKSLVLNRTNGDCMVGMFGSQPQDWVGHSITLCTEHTYLGREKTLCIRLFGSPDLAKDTPVTIRLPRRKPQTRTMHKTGPSQQQQKAATAKQYSDFIRQMAALGWSEERIENHCREKWNVDPKTLPYDRLVGLATTLQGESQPETQECNR